MGWWSDSIMGGDAPLDIEFGFEERFGTNDAEKASEEEFPEFRMPTAEESVEFINEMIRGGEDNNLVRQVTGFLVMNRAAPMSDELRRIILEGIDDEIKEGAQDWDDPASRVQTLSDFRELVTAYPSAGGTVELPRQPGLFETIMSR